MKQHPLGETLEETEQLRIQFQSLTLRMKSQTGRDEVITRKFSTARSDCNTEITSTLPVAQLVTIPPILKENLRLHSFQHSAHEYRLQLHLSPTLQPF